MIDLVVEYNRRIKRNVPRPAQLAVHRCPVRSDGQDDYDVIDGMIIGRIFKATRFPNGMPWQWSLAYGHHEDHTPTHGYEPTREQAMQAFARSWHREG